MITVKWGQACWRCDSCYSELWTPPTVLYTSPSQRNHFPAAVLCCSKGCEEKASRQLTAGDVQRLPWKTFLQQLNAAVTDYAST
jgi:hypothetical protein